ncbi:MAG: DUF4271 domain-containing protein [Chitinophagaceae bacterium]|nr:DUF4271 domain-containing protein [Chitinophagaceae bacterium]
MQFFKTLISLLFWVLWGTAVLAQTDSVTRTDSTPQLTQTIDSLSARKIADSLQLLRTDSIRRDSIAKAALSLVQPTKDTSGYRKYMYHPYLPLFATPAYQVISYYNGVLKDELFYVVLFLVFLLAFIKALFPKYFRNLFLLFFQTSLRQKQTREQLLQNGLASLLINLFFVISAALFLSLLTRYYGWSALVFEKLFAYIAALILTTYTGKYFFISFAGWVFNNKDAASAYLFLVATVNRIMGVLLLPLVVLFAFAQPAILPVIVTVGVGIICLLFVYRYLVSFGSLRNDLKLNPFHFFLYLCAVEITPIVLLYKLLVNYIG